MFTKYRIFNIEGYLSRFCSEEYFYIGINANSIGASLLNKLGIKLEQSGFQLPLAVGPVTRFNRLGRIERLKNLPKEYVSQRRYSRKTRRYLGTWSYWRWQRQKVEAPRVTVEVKTTLNGERLLVSPLLHHVDNDENLNRHVMNLFLEMFHTLKGGVNFYTSELAEMVITPDVEQKEWELLPQGHDATEYMKRLVENYNENKSFSKPTYQNNLLALNAYGPSNVAIGTKGFVGYIAYEFRDRGITIIECPNYGNATYVLPLDWEETSQLSKSDILSGNLCLDRIPHDKGWSQRIAKLMA